MKELLKKYKEIISYLIFGILTTVVSLLTYYLLVYTVLDPNKPLELQVANIISWIVCVTFAYITNKKYVFEKSDKPVVKEITEFYSSRIVSLLIDMFLMFIGVTVFRINDKIVKLFNQLLVIVLNYILSKFIVFKKKTEN